MGLLYLAELLFLRMNLTAVIFSSILALFLSGSLPERALKETTIPVVTFNQKPVNLQLYPRDNQDSGRVIFSGVVMTPGYDSIKVFTFKNNALLRSYNSKLNYSGSNAPFNITAKIHSELSEYKFIVILKSNSLYDTIKVADSIICGDAYLINGQSNSHRTDPLATYRNEYCRSFGKNTDFNIYNPSDTLWGLARGNDAVNFHTGVWGIKLQQMIKENYGIPVCIINGGSGGSSIEYNLRNNNNPADLNTTYGRLLYRVMKAGLHNSIKAMFWYQGESNTNASWSNYYVNFQNLHYSWKTDYPGIQKMYVFQIRMGCINTPYIFQSHLREVQRTLSANFPEVELMSTSGVQGHDGCHYNFAGYNESAVNIYNLVAHDFYGSNDTINIKPPEVKIAYFTSTQRNKLKIIFRDNCSLLLPNDTLGASLKDHFYLDSSYGMITSLEVNKDTLTLNLNGTSNAVTVTYLPNIYYNNTTILYKGPWLKNIRGIGALTFYKLPISAIVNITEGNYLPKEFMLYPNFPNPFNPETKIQFDVPTAGRVKLEIFDILGKSSEVPIDETLRPGRYNIVWSALKYSSGIYFYRLSAGNFVQTRKMIVVK